MRARINAAVVLVFLFLAALVVGTWIGEWIVEWWGA